MRDALDTADTTSARADLLLYCHGFCAALSDHHVGEDVALFPELSARCPPLGPTIATLTEDHELIASLLAQSDRALSSVVAPADLAPRVVGLAASGAVRSAQMPGEESCGVLPGERRNAGMPAQVGVQALLT